MQKIWSQYHLTAKLVKKYSHSTYLVSPIDQPEHQIVLKLYASSLFRFPYEHENLLKKARGIKKLQHLHLMPILDMGVEEGQPFVVCEYMPNGSLRDYLRKISPDRLDLRDALAIVSQVGQALIHAHDHHIAHGNVKPENIFLDANGEPVLADFSIVGRKEAIIRDQISEEYAFSYLAPEQFAGVCDAQSDQYALGCLAYELITGHVPLESRSLTSMIGQPTYVAPAAFPESIADLLPSSLEVAVLKTLAHDPDERFFDFSLFLDVIQSILSPLPAFPLLLSKHSPKDRAISNPASSAKTEITPSHMRMHVNSTVCELPEPSEVFSRVEDDLKEPIGADPTADGCVSEQMETVSSTELLASAQQSQLVTSSPPNIATEPTRRLWPLGSLQRVMFLCAALFIVITGSLLGLWYSNTYSSVPQQDTSLVLGNHHTNAVAKGETAVTAINGTPITTTDETPVTTTNVTPATATTSTSRTSPITSASVLQPSAPDCLRGSPSSLTFTIQSQFYDATGYQTVTLTNCGGSTTAWSYSSQTDYPEVDVAPYPLQGTIALNASQQVQAIVVIPAYAQTGTYHGSITFTKGTANWTVSITYTID